jgi:hypothetical protein
LKLAEVTAIAHKSQAEHRQQALTVKILRLLISTVVHATTAIITTFLTLLQVLLSRKKAVSFMAAGVAAAAAAAAAAVVAEAVVAAAAVTAVVAAHKPRTNTSDASDAAAGVLIPAAAESMVQWLSSRYTSVTLALQARLSLCALNNIICIGTRMHHVTYFRRSGFCTVLYCAVLYSASAYACAITMLCSTTSITYTTTYRETQPTTARHAPTQARVRQR